MIKLRMTFESIGDLMTPGVCGPIECVRGLPIHAKMVGIETESHDIVVFLFDDGEEKTSYVELKFEDAFKNVRPGRY